MRGYYRVAGKVCKFEGTRQIPGNPVKEVVLLRQVNSRLLVAMKSECVPVRQNRAGAWVKRLEE